MQRDFKINLPLCRSDADRPRVPPHRALATLRAVPEPRTPRPDEDPLESGVDEPITEGHAVPRRIRATRLLRGLAIDTTPLRRSRDFRLLWIGELISLTGRQVTIVALPLQVYLLTHSALLVGLIGGVQLGPLIVFSLYGGALADRMDRRVLIVASEIGLAATSALLVLGALNRHPPLARNSVLPDRAQETPESRPCPIAGCPTNLSPAKRRAAQ